MIYVTGYTEINMFMQCIIILEPAVWFGPLSAIFWQHANRYKIEPNKQNTLTYSNVKVFKEECTLEDSVNQHLHVKTRSMDKPQNKLKRILNTVIVGGLGAGSRCVPYVQRLRVMFRLFILHYWINFLRCNSKPSLCRPWTYTSLPVHLIIWIQLFQGLKFYLA